MKTTKKINSESIEDIFDKDMFSGGTIYLNNHSPSSLSYYSRNVSSHTISELVVLTGDTEYNDVKISANFPLFFESQYLRFIPNKVKRTIERYCSKSMLLDIHPDKETAVELCLIFLSNLSDAYYDNTVGWKRLHSKLLNEVIGGHNTYLKIINLLLKGTNKGPIIERSLNYTPGQESYRYRLADGYRDKGVTKYDFKTTYCRNQLSKQYFKRLDVAIKNPIARNLISMYSQIELPTIKEIKQEAKRLIKEGYRTKKGKILTMRNKHSNDYWVDADNRSFVEDNIELFLRLTENGFLIPTVGEERSGGRVTDSFVFMSSWIRNLCKINGERISEADYSTLHPNIAIKLYKGSSEYITHDKVSEMSGIDKKEVKVEHLSFFNKKWTSIEKSFLYDHYLKTEPIMMKNMFTDKDMFGHKITSKRLFKMEVDIMTSVIKRLNDMNIYVGYVYDALFCSQKNKSIVLRIMNEEIIKFGVKTIAK